MSGTAAERLRVYLAQLPPSALAMLARAFEREVAEGGANVAVATFVLAELRRVVRAPEADADPGPSRLKNIPPEARAHEAMRAVLQPLAPFLVDRTAPSAPGEIRRGALAPVWQWLVRDGAPEAVQAFVAAFDAEAAEALRAFQATAAAAIRTVLTPAASADQKRKLQMLGSAADDMPAIAAVLADAEHLRTLDRRLPGSIRVLSGSHVASVFGAFDVPALKTPDLLPFALAIVRQRLAAPWQIVRIALKAAVSDDAAKIAATPFAPAVTMAIQSLAIVAATLRDDIKRGRFEAIGDHLKALHEGVRGLRTEIDIRNDTAWGRQLSALRVDISGALQSEIEGVPGRVRRLLRARPDRDITAASNLDPVEVDEVSALIDFVAICRTYAGELALNEVTTRAVSELQHYAEQATEALVASLRSSDARTLAFREQQVRAAIRFCGQLFSRDYAELMTRAAEVALVDARTPSQKPAQKSA